MGEDEEHRKKEKLFGVGCLGLGRKYMAIKEPGQRNGFLVGWRCMGETAEDTGYQLSGVMFEGLNQEGR